MRIAWLVCLCFLSNGVTATHRNVNIKSDAFQDTLGHIRPRVLPYEQAEAARQLVKRLLGDRSRHFSVSVDPAIGPVDKTTFQLFKNRLGQVEVIGTTGVAVAWGLHYYLKNYCNCHIAWEGFQINLPTSLPDVDVVVTSNDRFQYYQNVCTAGYSTAWWDWTQWERHIDWMALSGINLALAFHGQEAIWERVYLQLNLTQDDIDEHFAGPAFLPWGRMGNIRGWGGPLTPSWHDHTVKLQHKILSRMRQLGIVPIQPAFSGHVPRAFSRLFPHAELLKVNPWCQFSDKYCCPFLLEPTDPLFKTVGNMFLREYINEFGTDHVYNCDTFNENEPQKSDLKFLRQIGRSIFSAITDIDPDGIWVMQGWLFSHEFSFWTEPRVEAYLTSVPIGKMIVLDLQSEQFPQYGRLKSYYGQPFIWCMLHNFGGTLGMFGSTDILNSRVFNGRNMKNSTMIGIGLTPEGINQNYVIYDFMTEMSYQRSPVDLDVWFENYVTRRYGAWNEYAVKAWKKLRNSVYNYKGWLKMRGKYVITKHPNIRIVPWTWYDPEVVLLAWDDLLEARYGRRNSSLYQHDVVDVTRQALQLVADMLYLGTVDAYKQKNISDFRTTANLFLALFDDLEEILASNENFLLGNWLRDAKSVATNDCERSWYEYNARNQITLWGPRREIRDYANKQWSGVVADYFKPRWALFVEALESSLVSGKPVNWTVTHEKIYKQVEQPFTFSQKIYPVTSNGDSIDIARRLNKKWRNIRTFPRIRAKHPSLANSASNVKLPA